MSSSPDAARSGCRALPLALVGLLALATASAQPAPDAMAAGRAHFDRGIALFDHGDQAGALGEFLRAWELTGRPSVLFNLGAAYQALHRYPEAIDALVRYLAQAPDAPPAQRAQAERAIAELQGLVAHLRVSTDPPDAAVTLDSRPVRPGTDSVAVGPGPHVVEATLAGRTSAREELVVASGETRDVRLVLAAATPEQSSGAPGARAILAITGVPADATVLVDGVAHPATASVEVAPGSHSVSVTAAGARPWHGAVTLSAGGVRTLRVALAPDRAGPRPLVFWGVTVGAGALAAAAGTLGVLAIQTHADFASRLATDPGVDALARRGRALSIAADGVGIAALAAVVLSVYLYTRTEFTPRSSSAELAVTPVPGGALMSARGRF